MNYDPIMSERLPKRIYSLLKYIGELGDKCRYNTYVVGGFVRDLILKWENLDIDIVVEGDAGQLASKLAKARRGKLKVHNQFNTAVVTLPYEIRVDFATARKESYERPGALPAVERGTIEDDLKRRDFTINAMAIKLNRNEFGEFVDPLNGKADLEKGIIRVIHEKSFQDDPTRIFRAIRYEQRYGLRLDENTKNLLKTAAKEDFLSTITKERLRNEILLILNEGNSADIINRAQQFNLIRYIHPRIFLSRRDISLIREVDEASQIETISLLKNEGILNMSLIKFMLIVKNLSEKEIKEVIENLALNSEYAENLIAMKTKLPDAIKAIKGRSIAPSDIYKALKFLSIHTLLFGIFNTNDKDIIAKIVAYIRILLEDEEPLITGNDLKKLGYPEGPMYSEILEDVFCAQLDEKVNTKQEAISYIQQKYKN